jgi:site-specific DNA recombinase
MNVILYARVSTREQSEGWSLPTQIEALRKFAVSHQFTVVAELEDAESGATLQRSGLEAVRALLRAGKAEGLVIYSLDRLARDFGQSWLLRDDLLRGGITIWYAQSGRRASLEGEDTLPDDLLALFAHREHKAIRERTMRGKRGKALDGRYIGNGTAPYGYTYVGRGKELEVVVNEEQARIVRRIFDEYVQQRSVRDIVDGLSAEGIPTPGELKGYANKKRGIHQWADTNIYDILNRTAYSGKAEFFRQKVLRDADGTEHRALNPVDDRLYVTVPALVDLAIWEAAQKRLIAGRERSIRRCKREYLLSGRRLRCECGYVMRGTAAVPKQGNERLFYRCGGAAKNAIKCNMVTLTGKRVDSLFWTWIKETMLNPENLRHELERQIAEQEERSIATQQELDMERGRLEQLAKQVERLLELYVDERIPRSALDTQIGAKTAAQDAVKVRIEELEEQLASLLTADIVEGLVAFSERVSACFEDVDFENNFALKQELVAVLNAHAVAFRDNGVVKLRFRSLLRETVVDYRPRPTNPLCSESGHP